MTTQYPALAAARSFLFVPGNRPERFEKAARSGADAVILDLEDSVPSTDKSEARSALMAQWQQTLDVGVPLILRINAADTPERSRDLDTISTLRGLAAVMVPVFWDGVQQAVHLRTVWVGHGLHKSFPKNRAKSLSDKASRHP